MSDGRGATWRRDLATAGLAAAPFVIHWLLAVVVYPRPFWAYWFDPEAMYFHSALELRAGTAPLDVDNPGTPVQALGALVTLFTGTDPTSFPAFLAVGRVLVLLSALAACVMLVRAFAASAGRVGVVAAVWLYALCPQALARATVWGAEPFQLFGGAVLLALLARAAGPGATLRSAGGVGLAAGALVGLKFTFVGFVPAVALGVFAAGGTSRARRAALALATCGAGFALATLPAAARWPDMARRVLAVAEPGRPAPWVAPGAEVTGYLDGLLAPFASARVWYLLVTLLAVSALVTWRRAPTGRERALIAFGVAALVLTHLVASRSTFLRYHLPGGVAAMALVSCLPLPRRRSVAWLGLTLLAALVARQIAMDVGSHRRLTREHVQLRDAAGQAIRDDAGDREVVVVYGGRFPDPAFALRLFARTDAQREAIGAAHPRSGLYDRRDRHLETPGGARWDYLVLEDHDLATFPGAHGDVIATVGAGNRTTSTYRIVRR